MSNWYDNPTVITERAVLTSTIEFKHVADIEAEFLIPVFTPTQDNSSGNSVENIMRAPSIRSQKGRDNLTVNDYREANNIRLTIPAYIVNEFYDPFMLTNYIPKGTEFIISGVGEKTNVDQIRITAYFGEPDDQLEFKSSSKIIFKY